MQADGERFDEVEAAARPGFVHGQHGALAEDIGHELKAFDGVVGQGQRIAGHALAGGGIDVDFERFGFRAGVGLLDQGLKLAEQVGLFQRGHVEEHHRPVAEEDRDAVGPRGDGHGVGRQPVRRAERTEVEAFAHEEGAGLEIGFSRLDNGCMVSSVGGVRFRGKFPLGGVNRARIKMLLGAASGKKSYHF